MPTPDIEKLRELIAEATQLPWHVDKYNCYVWGPAGEMVADSRVGAARNEFPEETGEPIIRARGTGGGLPIGKNMALLVAAVNALPALLDSLPSPVSVPEGDAREIARNIVAGWCLGQDCIEQSITAALLSARREGLETAVQAALSLRDEAEAGRWTDAARVERGEDICSATSGDAWTMGFGFAMNLLAKRIRALPLSSSEEG